MVNPDRDNIRLFLVFASCLLFLVSFSIIHVKDVNAHKVQMFAYAEGDKVLVDGYFPDGKKAMNSEVIVYDNRTGEMLLSGRTDDMGKFSFMVHRKTDLKIALNASLGHKTEYLMPGSDLPDIAMGNNPPKSPFKKGGLFSLRSTQALPSLPLEKGGEGGFKKGSSNENSQATRFSQVDEAGMQAMIEKSVERGVSPLMRGFSECKERVFFSEIIGGIGYIFGILGIVLYFKARKGQQ